jgi:hypothetical protein
MEKLSIPALSNGEIFNCFKKDSSDHSSVKCLRNSYDLIEVTFS